MGRIWSNGSGLPLNASNLNSLEGDVSAAKTIRWTPSTFYAAGTAVLSPAGDVVTANAAHTSGASFTAANWKRNAMNKGDLFFSVMDYGAKGDGTTDDTTAIQNAINAAASEAVNTSMGGRCVVVIPGGHYKTTATITQPPYVKVRTEASATIESYVTGGTAWWVSPLSTDPANLYSKLKKEQWNKGYLIDGSRGALVLINMTGSYGTTTGLELGSRSNISRDLARYSLCDVAVQDYQTGLQLNTYNHYVAHYYRLHLESNATQVHIGVSGVNNVNSGENINFIDSIIAGGTGVVIDADTMDLTFRSCSFDFLGTAFKINRGWLRILIDGGHMESINAGSNRTTTGGIAVASQPTNDVNPKVVIKGMTPFVQSDRGTMFRGTFDLWLEMIYRYTGNFTTYMGTEDNWLCDDTVNLHGLSIVLPSTGPLVSKTLNGVKDPNFANETAGTAVASLANYTVVSVSNTTGVVATDGPRSGANSIQANINGNGYLRITPKTYMACRPGETIGASMAYKFAGTPYPTLTIYGSFYDSEKALLSTVTRQIYISQPTSGSWNLHDGAQLFQVPKGAVYFKPDFMVSSSAGVNTNNLYVSDLNVYRM